MKLSNLRKSMSLLINYYQGKYRLDLSKFNVITSQFKNDTHQKLQISSIGQESIKWCGDLEHEVKVIKI